MLLALRYWLRLFAAVCCGALQSCGTEKIPFTAKTEQSKCGSEQGVVDRVIDGDTFTLEDQRTVRIRGIDSPEWTSEEECYGREAMLAARSWLVGREVELLYGLECHDRYDRTLARVFVDKQDIASRLLEYGLACAYTGPFAYDNSSATSSDYSQKEFEKRPGDQVMESGAKSQAIGLWGACTIQPCGDIE